MWEEFDGAFIKATADSEIKLGDKLSAQKIKHLLGGTIKTYYSTSAVSSDQMDCRTWI